MPLGSGRFSPTRWGGSLLRGGENRTMSDGSRPARVGWPADPRSVGAGITLLSVELVQELVK